ncbi:glycosyltransferase [Dorea sp.]
MNILFLCGYFEPKYQDEISRKTKTWVENAANTFQQRVIWGLKNKKNNLKVVSAPFIGPWPTAYKDRVFKGFEAGESDENIEYIFFDNTWGYRNISRTIALKKCVKKFVENSKEEKKAIIVYCPHTPFLEAAVFGKKMDSSIHIHMIVPDLPQYMNLSKKAHPIYDFFKKIDIYKMEKLIKEVDSFTLLTNYMAEKLKVQNRPYIVVEGIADTKSFNYNRSKKNEKKVAYAGKLVEAFGAKRLVEAFEQIEDSEASLHICGGGELKEYIKEMSRRDTRIHYYGMVSAEEANKILSEADVVVNPRQNDDEYTKYSFPSKNIEYLMTGNAVVAYMLDGIPEIYRNFFVIPESDSIEDLALAIEKALNLKKDDDEKRIEKMFDYMQKTKSQSAVAESIINLIKQ